MYIATYLKSMIKLSVVIITFNEELNIERCIKSVETIADEIVVVDSFSTDKTEEICAKYKVNFLKNTWQGYSNQKNFGNKQAKYDWVLSIDADETISNELKNTILNLKHTENTPRNYRMKRLVNYCGKWIHHGGWYPDIKVRLFDRRINEWEGIIHERINVKDEKNIEILKGNCFHYTYNNLTEHINQANKFTDILSKAMFDKGIRSSFFKLLINPIIKFFKDDFFMLGFLDGYYGFLISRISAHATFLKYAKLKQLQTKKVVK